MNRDFELRHYLVIDTVDDIPIWLDLIEQSPDGYFGGMLMRVSPTMYMYCGVSLRSDRTRWICHALETGYRASWGAWIASSNSRADVETALVEFFSGDVNDETRYEADRTQERLTGEPDVCYIPYMWWRNPLYAGRSEGNANIETKEGQP